MKVGKTTFAVQAPRNLLVAFEKGYNALPGIKAIDVTKWTDFKRVLKQLGRPEVQAMYDTVSLDTVGIMWELVEKHVCIQNDVSTLGDIPWGKGYSMAKQEFDEALRTITMLGYGLIIIAHVDTRMEKRPDDSEVEIIGPAIPKRAYAIVNALVDIIGYIAVDYDSDGNSFRTLYTRSTPTVMAGSRFPHLPAKIPFGYKELSNALADAIEESGRQDGAIIVDSADRVIDDGRAFSETMDEVRQLWDELKAQSEDNLVQMKSIITEIFGQPVKLSSVTERQQDLIELVIGRFKEIKS